MCSSKTGWRHEIKPETTHLGLLTKLVRQKTASNSRWSFANSRSGCVGDYIPSVILLPLGHLQACQYHYRRQANGFPPLSSQKDMTIGKAISLGLDSGQRIIAPAGYVIALQIFLVRNEHIPTECGVGRQFLLYRNGQVMTRGSKSSRSLNSIRLVESAVREGKKKPRLGHAFTKKNIGGPVDR